VILSIWLDDIHVKSGMSSVYRRDFDHGIVLVNPSDMPMTATLERPFRKILGTVSPEINDGTLVSSVTLAGGLFTNGIGDAIFLIDRDETPPSAVDNLSGL
jgi:hypothetical protein